MTYNKTAVIPCAGSNGISVFQMLCVFLPVFLQLQLEYILKHQGNNASSQRYKGRIASAWLHNSMTYTPVDLSVEAILQQKPEAD